MIKNKKYTANKKNGGRVPAVTDIRTEYVPAKCGQCMECKKQKAREWQIRLAEEIKQNKNGKFITLTFNNESLQKLQEMQIKTTNKNGERIHTEIKSLPNYIKENAVATIATRLFNERYRKKYKKAIRHWLITELGHKGTERIHIHGIIWTDIPMEKIEKLWSYGWIWKGNIINGKLENYVNSKTINYITKYLTKRDEIHKDFNGKILCSPGIGKDYINTTTAQEHEFKKKLK